MLDPDALLGQFRGSPGLARGAAVAAGLLLLVAGGRVYRLAVVVPGVAGGLLLGLSLAAGASADVRTVAAVALGFIGGALFWLAERVAVAGAGLMLGAGLGRLAAPLLPLGGLPPWIAPLAAGVAGLLVFPWLWRRALLPVVTAGLGALALAWAFGVPDSAVVVGGLWAVGAVVQLAAGRRRRS